LDVDDDEDDDDDDGDGGDIHVCCMVTLLLRLLKKGL
jgi:hypothetical protein